MTLHTSYGVNSYSPIVENQVYSDKFIAIFILVTDLALVGDLTS